jgi:hypothetical protein
MAIALGRLGRTPEARVRWALQFRSLALGRLAERDRHRAWALLRSWQGGNPAQEVRPAQDGVLEVQLALRECIEALANGLPDLLYVPQDPEIKWVVRPAPRRRPGARRSGHAAITVLVRKRRPHPVSPAAVVFAFVNDLNAIEADRLRACPLKTDETPCGVIFLAARRQIFCSSQHAQAAAWQRYQPKRKERRS